MLLFNQKILVTTIISFLFFIQHNCVEAKQSDFYEKITINSDNQFADMNSDYLVFNDNVVITQGTLVIKANKVEVFKKNNNQHGKLIAYGKPASYKQVMEDGSQVIATGNMLSYDMTDRFITIKGDGKVKKQDNEIQGDLITYDMNKGKLHASKKQGQVQTILIPDQIIDKK